MVDDFDIPINQRVIQQLSSQTIRYPIDAIVELVTNSDDSYKRLAAHGEASDGYIEIVINYKKRSINEIYCIDHAEGMTKEELLKNIEFAAETSKFNQHKSIRGLFGRGLKEAIFGLGKGEIITCKDNIITTLYLYKNEENKYRGRFGSQQFADEKWRKFAHVDGNGTIVRIQLLENRFLGKLETQIQQHYALRNILTAEDRNVYLRLNNIYKKLQYQYPERTLIVDKLIKISENDQIKLVIYESNYPLDDHGSDLQYADFGLLVEVEGNILDNVLFGYENEPAGHYFSGKIVWNGLATYLRKNDFGVLNSDRSGISWRHPYCNRVREAVRDEIKAAVERKKAQLEKGENATIPKKIERGLDKIAEELSKLFENEIEEVGKLTKSEKTSILKNMLLIKPNKANIELGIPRPLTVYASNDIFEEGVKLTISSSNIEVEVDRETVDLKPHKKYNNILYGTFKVIGKKVGEVSTITASIGDYNAAAEVSVKPQKKSKKKKKLSINATGRWFNKIIANQTPTPIQRVRFNRDTGNIEIYVKFPVLETYLKVDLSGASQPSGRLLLSELLTEVFCREVALEKIEKGQGVNDILGFLRMHDDYQKKYAKKIAEIVEDNIWLVLNVEV
jgi:hypothetical protein